MNLNSALIVVSEAGSASVVRLKQAIAESSLRVAVCLETEALACTVNAEEPGLVILGPDLAHPIGIGRSLRVKWASTHILFVQKYAAIAQFRRALSHAPQLGYHWSLGDYDDTSLAQQIGNAAATTRRRTQLRTTLDRANQKLASAPAFEIEQARRVMSEHYLANFLAQASESIIATDARGRVLYWNASVRQLLGLDDSQQLGMDLSSLSIWSPRLVAAIASTDGPDTAQWEVTYRRIDEEMVLEVGYSLVRNIQGEPVGITLVIRDNSERHRSLEAEREEHRLTESMLIQVERMVDERTASLKSVEQALHQAQKLESLGKLTGGVAHDFNNILQIIGGNLELLKDQLQGHGAASYRIDMATEAVGRGAKLASQLLAFARKQPLQPVATNLARIVSEMDGLLRRTLGETIEIETVIGGGLWTAMVDRNHLENVILNLAINARDAMDGEGLLTIELGNALLDDHYVRDNLEATPGQYVMLAVTDTGKGMAPDVIERVFEPFYTTKPESEGTGLGLSMAYGFVKQSSGHIKIYSEPDSGTTIKVYLPRIHQMEAGTIDLRPLPTVGGSETILVVEDDPAVCATVVDLLSALGYTVLKASDGQSGLNVLQSGILVDLLFTDVVMPGVVRSTDLARHAKDLHPGIQILFTSGYTQNAIVHGDRLDQDVELISKPYRREDLAKKIRALLSKQGKQVGHSRRLDLLPIESASPIVSVPRSILVVEDNDDARQMLCELLLALGYTPLSAASGKEALDHLREQHVDILLTDVGLPGISGEELACQANAANPSLKIVFTSGHGAVKTEGFTSYSLPKPYSLQDLKNILESV